jgi:hypothetical protein
MKKLFDQESLLTDKEVRTFKEKLKIQVITSYENIAKQGIFIDIKNFVGASVLNAFDALLVHILTVSLTLDYNCIKE